MIYVIYDITRTTFSNNDSGVISEEQAPILTIEPSDTFLSENTHQTAPLMVSEKSNYGSLPSSV